LDERYDIKTAEGLGRLLMDLKFGLEKAEASEYLESLPLQAQQVIKGIRDQGAFRINCASKEALERYLEGSGKRMLREKAEELSAVSGAPDQGLKGMRPRKEEAPDRQGALEKAGVPPKIAKTLLRQGGVLANGKDIAFQSEAGRLGGMVEHLRKSWGVSDGLRDLIVLGSISLLETGDDALFMRDASIVAERIAKVDALISSVTGWERPPSNVRESVLSLLAPLLGGKAQPFESKLREMRKADEFLESALPPGQRAQMLKDEPGLLMMGIDELKALVAGMKKAGPVAVGQ